MGYIALPSILNAIIGITSYYCVILKIVILHDGINTIQNGFFCFLWKKNKSLFLFKKPKKNVFFQKKQVGCFFLKKNGFFSTLPVAVYFVARYCTSGLYAQFTFTCLLRKQSHEENAKREDNGTNECMRACTRNTHE